MPEQEITASSSGYDTWVLDLLSPTPIPKSLNFLPLLSWSVLGFQGVGFRVRVRVKGLGFLNSGLQGARHAIKD